MLVLHYTGMQTAQAALDRLCDPQAAVSSHYVIEEDGTVWALVPESARAFHAGISFWRGARALNGRSIGIEIVNPGHEWGYRSFPPAQMHAVAALCRGILSRHPIPPGNVVAHSDIAPDRKQDPGELFDWPWLATLGIGLYPAFTTGDAAPHAPTSLHACLAAIGYDVTLPGVVTAFQRRFMPTRPDGIADAQTFARALQLRDAFAASSAAASS